MSSCLLAVVPSILPLRYRYLTSNTSERVRIHRGRETYTWIDSRAVSTCVNRNRKEILAKITRGEPATKKTEKMKTRRSLRRITRDEGRDEKCERIAQCVRILDGPSVATGSGSKVNGVRRNDTSDPPLPVKQAVEGGREAKKRQIRRPSRGSIFRVSSKSQRVPIIADTVQECDCAPPTGVFTICFGCEKRIKRSEEVYTEHRR